MEIHYDIEADWILLSRCNFRCQYCFWGETSLKKNISPMASTERLAKFFDNSGLIWLLHITGGEPFLYPDFISLIHRLTERHFISLNTNLDVSKRVNEFAKTISPERVLFINASLHVEEREKHKRMPTFVRAVHHLRQLGFRLLVTQVMYPPIFVQFSQIFETLKKEDIVVIPKAFRGNYLGKVYPQGYTDDERKIFTEYSIHAEEFYTPLLAEWPERPTIDPFLDRQWLRGIPVHRGKLCYAGQKFVRIREDGEIWRCGPQDGILGNISSGEFRPAMRPMPCRNKGCPYFCQKYLVRTLQPSGGAKDHAKNEGRTS